MLGDVLIDLACGFGFFAIPAAKIVGPKGVVCGVDIDQEALEELREKAALAGLRNLRLNPRRQKMSFCASSAPTKCSLG